MSEAAIVPQTTVLSTGFLVSIASLDSGLRPGSGEAAKVGSTGYSGAVEGSTT